MMGDKIRTERRRAAEDERKRIVALLRTAASVKVRPAMNANEALLLAAESIEANKESF